MEMDSDRLAGSGFEDYVRVDDGGNVRSISQGSDESVVEEERGVDEVSSVNERKVFPVELSRNVMKLTCESSAKCGSCDVYLVGTGILPRRRSRDQLLETPGCFLGVMLRSCGCTYTS